MSSDYRVYSNKIPQKLELFMINQWVRLLEENHKKIGLL